MRERTIAEMMVLDLLVGTDGSGVRSNHRISVRTVQETRCTFFVIFPFMDTALPDRRASAGAKINESTGSSSIHIQMIGGYSISKSCLLDLMVTTYSNFCGALLSNALKIYCLLYVAFSVIVC